MPVNVFGNSSSSNNNGNKIDTIVFVQKPYLKTIYIESRIEGDIELKINTELKIYQILLVSDKLVVKIMLIIYSMNAVY